VGPYVTRGVRCEEGCWGGAGARGGERCMQAGERERERENWHAGSRDGRLMSGPMWQ
jgi:hypothetical protein